MSRHAPIQCVFFLTPGRSGSMWLAWAFHQLYYSVISLHEPGIMLKDLAFDHYHFKIPDSVAKSVLTDIKLPGVLAAHKYMKKTHYIEVGRNLFSLAYPLRRAMEHDDVILSFLGIVGDGRVFVRSMINKGAYIKHRPFGWFRPVGHTHWDSYTQVEKLSWHWKEKVRCVRECASTVYRIEDLTISDSCRRNWNTMATTIKLPAIRNQAEYDRVRNTRKNHVPCNIYKTFDEIPLSDRQRFWSIAGDTMQSLGYDCHESRGEI